MHSDDLDRSLPALFSELVYGAPETDAFVLNRGDRGLLKSLDLLSADEASASREGGASIAAHIRHVAYGLSLMNRWASGENPFSDADWSAAWEGGAVSEEDWSEIRQELRREADKWHEALARSREIRGFELDGVLGSIIHIAYHLGAIRQIHAGLRGPRESGGHVPR